MCKKLVSIFASVEETVLIFSAQEMHLLIVVFGQEELHLVEWNLSTSKEALMTIGSPVTSTNSVICKDI